MNEAERARFLTGLVGKAYRIGAEGPDAYDCEGLARHILRSVFGIALPKIGEAARERRTFIRVDAPVDGTLVITGANSFDRHVGVYLRNDGGGVIHAVDNAGVVFDSMLAFCVRCPTRVRFYRATLPT